MIKIRDKYETLKCILDCGIIAAIRAPDVERGLNLAEAARRGGITALEITMTVPGALEVIRELVSRYADSEVVIGAGTVLDAETARLAIISGVEFVVGPHLNLGMLRISNRYQKVCIPGAMSVTEVVSAMEHGADAVKIFPASLFGPRIIKAIREPLPQARLIPMGGVNVDNVAEWLEAGAVAVGVGGDLTKEALAKGDYSLTEQKAKQFITRIREAREKLKGVSNV